MRKTLSSLLAVVALSALAPAHAAVLELQVQGLNCTLCSDEMKAEMMISGRASALEPKLECGVIFVETAIPKEQAKAALEPTLTKNGFNLLGVSESKLSMAEAGKLPC